MEEGRPLDDISVAIRAKNGRLSFRFMLIAAFSFISIIVIAIFDNSSDAVAVLVLLAVLSFAISTILGLFFSVRSIIKKEKDTLQKVLGIIGNIVFSLILLGFVAFLIVDLMSSPFYQ